MRLTHIAFVLKTVWLVACVFVLVGFLVERGDAEAEGFLTWIMQVLSFPLGLFAPPFILVTGFLAQITPLGSLLTTFGDYVMVWFWYFVFGCVQWLLLVLGIVWLVKKSRSMG